MRWRAGLATTVGSFALAALGGCNAVYEYPKSGPEDAAGACGDGVDNDLDGRADCYDPSCAEFCRESSEARCTDGVDNDFDGVGDCFDSRCASYCHETTPARCADGLDNDQDGQGDCADPACAAYCSEATNTACHNGADDDENGETDCADAACAPFCMEEDDPACHDGSDNDLDGRADCRDPACSAACDESSANRCTDGIDNDQDSLADCRDEDCKASCPEASAPTCADGVDNDFDRRQDCDDPDCDGFCPEESSGDCSDARDNDGDGLSDVADPRCWRYGAPVVQRCGVADPVDFVERFDWNDPLGPPFFYPRWFEFGTFQNSTGRAQAIVNWRWRDEDLTGRNDVAPYFTFNTTNDATLGNNLGGMSSTRTFVGEWSGFVLAFAAFVPQNAMLRVAMLPTAAAPAGQPPNDERDAALMAVTLDGTVSPPTLSLDSGGSRSSTTLPLPQACGLRLCDGGWSRVAVAFRDGHLEVTMKAPGGEVTLSGSALPSLELPESRLVVWGGSISEATPYNADYSATEIDDVHLRLASPDPCGVSAPQMPFASCGYAARFGDAGETVALARDEAGSHCALVSARRAGVSGGPDTVTAWTSSDGKDWAPALASGSSTVFDAPAGSTLVGAGIAHDGDELVAVVATRSSDGVRLAFDSAAGCAGLGPFADGPLLPADAEAPSYVVSGGRHAIYFTRPPTDQTGRTLWRVSRDDPSFDAEIELLAELPTDAFVGEPVSVTRVGATDLVLTYPTQSTLSGLSGVGVLVGDGTGSSFTALAPVPFLSGAGRGGFDDDGITAAAMSWGAGGGFFLYGGSRSRHVTAGTALLWPAGTTPPVAPPACGDGACAGLESCATCPGDCACPGVPVLEDPFTADRPWTVVSADTLDATSNAYVDPATWVLAWSGTFDERWSVLPLNRSIVGDFDLAFDFSLAVTTDDPSCDPALIGLGETPTTFDYDPPGAYARFSYQFGCNTDQFGLTPFVRTQADFFTTMPLVRYLNCASGALGVDVDARRHIVLARRGSAVTVSVYDGHGCATTQTVEYTGSLPNLPALLVGTGAANSTTSSDCKGVAFEVSNLVIRMPEDPAQCGASLTVCGAAGQEPTCVDTASSQEHCGACGTTCADGLSCIGSACECAAGTRSCGGVCVDVLSSVTDCGACGSACGSFCLLGVCGLGETCATPGALPPGAGHYDLDLINRQTDIEGFGALNDVAFTWRPTEAGPFRMRARGVGRSLPRVLVTTRPACDYFEYFPQVGGPDLGFVEELYLSADPATTYYVVIGFSSSSGTPTDGRVAFDIEAL